MGLLANTFIAVCCCYCIAASVDAAEASRSKLSFQFRTEDPFSYSLSVGSKQWMYNGDVCLTSNGTKFCALDGGLTIVGGRNEMQGTDDYGSFDAQSLKLQATDSTIMIISARVYADGKTIVFEQHFPDGLDDCSVGDADDVLSVFPSFVAGDSDKYDFESDPRGYVQWKGGMLGSGAVAGRWKGDGLEQLGSGLQDTGPIAVFTKTKTLVISAASQFMSVNQVFDKSTSRLSFGIMGRVTSIEPGYSVETIVSLTNAGDVSQAMDEWGDKLLRRYHKSRDVAFSDLTTNYLGYSTDNGAFYYYHTEEQQNYEKTIVDVKTYADKVGLPYRHWLMDSWWYYKGDGNGVKNWTAMGSIFPDGADSVYNETQWPVVAHNRYWSANTDYAKQNGGDWDFIIEPESHGGLAMPLQQEFWDWLLADARKWGLRTYEQDWLYNEFSEMNCTLESATLARQWLLQMGNGAEKNGLTVQYCMSWCRHMLQSVEIQAVTQARASGDYHPGNDQWKMGLSSVLAHAIGVRPTKDNFWSTPGERGTYGNDSEVYNRLQAVVSTLSTGPVAPSDEIGMSDVQLILRSCAADGKLLQPDRPAVLSSNSIFARAGIAPGDASGEVWVTLTSLSGYEFHYVLAAESAARNFTLDELAGTATALPQMMAWESNTTSDVRLFDAAHPIALPSTDKHTFNLWTAAPELSNGFVFMGEANTKWVAVSNDRFADLVVYPDMFYVTATGAPGEKIELMYVAPADDSPTSFACTFGESGSLQIAVPAFEDGEQCK